MGYYEKQAAAFRDIDRLVNEGNDIKTIYYIIQTRYGFGIKTVDKRVKVLEDMRDVLKKQKSKK